MIDVVPPFIVYILGAFLVANTPAGILRSAVLCLIPLIGGALVWNLDVGTYGQISAYGLDLVLLRVDKLSVIFALIFSLAGFLAMLYAWHIRDTVQQIAALLYSGSAIGAVFAGDLITLFVFWEGTAIASVFLIWARRTEGAYHTGMRYLIMQIASGVILIAGTALYYRDTGSIAFDQMTLGSLGTWLILLAFGIKCAFPLLHNWLSDAYPAATVTGTVVLSAFTTKLAVYTLARGFPGTDLLIYLGAVMALFPLVYAAIENDLRRVLAYALNNQLGFMVVGVGIGTELALNGVAAHAFVHILYKALMFMAVGAVLFRTGTAKASQLGGLYRTMPVTMLFCLVGAASVAAFPLFSSFVSKSLILSAAGKEHYWLVWAILVGASAGVFLVCGLKVVYCVFFGPDSGKRPKEAPWNMLLAMGATAALCIGIGSFPAPLYALLPYDIKYEPYTTSHVITQLQFLAFGALAFTVLKRTGIYPTERRSVTLDSDWSYRRAAPAFLRWANWAVSSLWTGFKTLALDKLWKLTEGLYSTHGPEGRLARVWPTGSMVLWLAVILAAALLVNFIS